MGGDGVGSMYAQTEFGESDRDGERTENYLHCCDASDNGRLWRKRQPRMERLRIEDVELGTSLFFHHHHHRSPSTSSRAATATVVHACLLLPPPSLPPLLPMPRIFTLINHRPSTRALRAEARRRIQQAIRQNWRVIRRIGHPNRFDWVLM